MGWWNNLNFMSNPNQSWSAPSYRGDFGASTSINNPVVPQVQQTRPVDRFSQLEFPELQNQALGTYKDYLAKAPTRDQYNPNVWEKIGAALAGSSTAWASKNPGAGLEVTRNFLDDRYNRAVQDWDIKGKGLAAAANIEENENTNKMRTWQGRNDSILKAREQADKERKTDSDIDYQRIRGQLTQAQINQIENKAKMGESFETILDDGRKIFGRKVLDSAGNVKIVVDTALPTLEGRKQEFNEKDSTRNFNLRSMDTMFDNNLNAKEFGERQTQNAFERGMSEKRLGLDEKRLGNETARTGAYVKFTENGGRTSPSPENQSRAEELAINDIVRTYPEARGLFTKDPKTGKFVINNAASYDTVVTDPVQGKKYKINDLIEFYANQRLGVK